MADISITAAQVIPSSQADIRNKVIAAAVTVTAGQLVALNSSGLVTLHDADGSSPAQTVFGVAALGGGPGQTIPIVVSDPALVLGAGASLTVGQVLYASDTAGGITATYADLEAGDYVTVVGVVTIAASGTVNFKLTAAGAAIA